jgi:hypothetical protein
MVTDGVFVDGLAPNVQAPDMTNWAHDDRTFDHKFDQVSHVVQARSTSTDCNVADTTCAKSVTTSTYTVPIACAVM